jgi:hypothetical protein
MRSAPDGVESTGAALYLDTSVALRATLEQDTTPAPERRIAAAGVLVTRASRWSNRHAPSSGPGHLPESASPTPGGSSACCGAGASDGSSAPVCDLACVLHPRTLDALHLAAYVLARGRIEALKLLTADHRQKQASRSL